MNIIGIDLSGPSNHKDTVAAAFHEKGERLEFDYRIQGASDVDLLDFVSSYADEGRVIVGIDSPLSYQDGGGDRLFDRELRRFAKDLGMKSGSVMTPTLTRMIYLTARGIHLAHSLKTIERVEVVEVHPGVALASRLSAEDFHHALSYKKEPTGLEWVTDWLTSTFLTTSLPPVHESHDVDAVLASIAAWHWAAEGKSPTWCMDAEPPHYPFPITT
ncbi:DUF429 domain-containing protein [Halobacillus locisalis]|uniref:DUF429 domain-containing protein n=1 Tax=Halobacillus locisalis TaxID=220753 RepID=A0A838CTK1_9BACI|nr:DUF429 domain-containing protein [Halobacillus locisalis]MBA2175095.1 DUF429 domain-containing protein [Halobacillus locisalis]